MEYLVHIDIQWPTDGDPEEFARITTAERARARELGTAGSLRRLWRVPGERSNWGIWEAPDATALHAVLSSLPLYPWLAIEVFPLAQHPSDPERPGGA
jgi:muconolactone D-isomerase